MAILEALIKADENKARRQQLDIQNKTLNAELITRGYDPNTLDIIPNSAADVQRAQNQQALQLANALQGKLAAQDTDNAIIDFSQTGDATYLQKALDNNPAIKQAWEARGVKQVSNIDWQNDASLLARNQFNPAEYDTPEKQDILRRNVYKYYDGTDWNLGLLNNVVKETGFMSRVGQNRGQIALDNFEQFRNFMAGPRSSPNTAEGHKYEREITRASEETGVPANLLAAMMNVESSNRPDEVSNKGATGLMQLMPDTAKSLGVTDLTDPAQNIMGGAKYMAQLLKDNNGDLTRALAAYNAGPGNVAKYNGVPPFSETQNYISKIMSNYANGESYYQAANFSPDSNGLQNASARLNSVSDQRIATIQNFVRGNANASKGLTNENADMIAKADMIKAMSQAEANRVKASVEGPTATQKDLFAAEAQTKTLVDNFGGEEKFFSTDFSKPENFNQAWRQVVNIGKLEGTTLTNEDKKNITDIRSLINLADPAIGLNSSQTGLVDSYLTNVEKYISDAGSGVDHTAAMASFRNTLRHALYGSTLTDGEIAAFNEAFGSNRQKLGPVLEQFKVALNQIQSKLNSAANLSNPYTMHVMIGADQKKLLSIREALQQRIDYVEGMVNKDGSSVVPKPTQGATPQQGTAPQQRRSLDSIFGGN